MVLQGIQDRVRGNNLTLMRFNPKEDVLEDNYSGKKIEVTVTSSFANLRIVLPAACSISANRFGYEFRVEAA